MSFIVADLAAALGLNIDESAWKRGDALIHGAKMAVEAFVGFEAAKKVGEAINATIELGSKLNDTSQKTGLATDALQEYGYIAKQNSSDVDQFAAGVTKLSRGLYEATTKGTGPAADALHALGLSLNAGEFKNANLDQRITLISKALNKFPDGTKKSALAMDLLGKSGAELIPTLNNIAEEGEELRQEFKDSGAEMSTGDIADLDALGDNVDKLKSQLGGLKNQIVIALLPALKDMVEGLMAWMKENRELIKSGVETVVNTLSLAFGILGKVVHAVVAVIQFFQQHETLAEAAITSLGLIMAAFAAEAVIDWAIAFAPVVGIVALITGVILVVNSLLEAIFDGTGVIHDFGEAIGDAFSSVGASIKAVFVGIYDFFAGIAGAVRDAFESVIEWISDKIDWIWDKIKSAANYVTHPWEIVSDAVDYFQGDDDSAMAAPSRDFGSSSRAGNTVTYGDTSIKIDAKNADAEQVGSIVEKKIQENHDRTMRDAQAATGGSDNGDD